MKVFLLVLMWASALGFVVWPLPGLVPLWVGTPIALLLGMFCMRVTREALDF